MSKEGFIEKLKDGNFYYILADSLFIRSEITEVFEENGELSIQFEAGDVQVALENIEECKVEKEFYEWKYNLKDVAGKYLGMIYKR